MKEIGEGESNLQFAQDEQVGFEGENGKENKHNIEFDLGDEEQDLNTNFMEAIFESGDKNENILKGMKKRYFFIVLIILFLFIFLPILNFIISALLAKSGLLISFFYFIFTTGFFFNITKQSLFLYSSFISLSILSLSI